MFISTMTVKVHCVSTLVNKGVTMSFIEKIFISVSHSKENGFYGRIFGSYFGKINLEEDGANRKTLMVSLYEITFARCPGDISKFKSTNIWLLKILLGKKVYKEYESTTVEHYIYNHNYNIKYITVKNGYNSLLQLFPFLHKTTHRYKVTSKTDPKISDLDFCPPRWLESNCTPNRNEIVNQARIIYKLTDGFNITLKDIKENDES